MPITKDSGRKTPFVAEVTIGYANLTSGVAAEAINVPAGLVIDEVFFFVDTAWNSATSDVIIVGDGGDTDRFIASVSIAATGGKTMASATGKGYKYTTSDTIDVTWTGVGAAPSAGSGRLVIIGHHANQADFAQR